VHAESQDYDGHLRAIHGLASALEQWQKGWDEAANEASSRRNLSERDVDDAISIFYDAGFADLARSHAFICTTAAFTESLFSLCLPKVGEVFRGRLVDGHPRVLRFATSAPSFWDPRKPKDDRSGIATRIRETLEGAGLLEHFGPDFGRLMAAIFAYRNEMVHNGYEWPLETRREFMAKIRKEDWAGWFSVAKSGDEPWFFAMTPAFYGACLELCNRSLLAFEGLVQDDWERYDLRYRGSAGHSSL
jgi:hypothetical protein